MSKPSPESTGPRRSLLVALVVTLALAGLLGALVLLTGGDDTSAGTGSADDVAPIATEAAPVETAAPTTQPPTTTSTTTTTTTSTTTTTIAPTTTVATPMFPMLPDGSPEPILAIYDGPTIRVSGWVPSQEKADQLIALALANSTDPNAVIEGELQIDPLVPLNIGTRVIEMNSPRFGPGSSEVTPEHALQLDRVANVMKLLPNVTATVVGHADQLGDESANYALSEARAVSVVRYLVGQGVEPARLAARAVGEQDLLSEDDSDAALALNRRTEFIFYGLIAD
jgi:outer membrane protein OmpA-like peptidoglycan-associated protein